MTEKETEYGIVESKFRSLSGKLLVLTILFVMIAEVLIYVPSVANFRNVWLHEKLESASVVAIATMAGPQSALQPELQRQLLATLGLELIAMRSRGQRVLVASAEMLPDVSRTHDLTSLRPLDSIRAAFLTLLSSGDRSILVAGQPPAGFETMEIVLKESSLRGAMLIYSRNILLLSLAISIFSAALVYLTLRRTIVRPVQRITTNMAAFSADPDDPDNIIRPSGRHDEIGQVENRLATMQHRLRETLTQQRHLADLGLAVSKINHDLRNILASAQLFSDRLGSADDPLVKRFAPKIVNAIDRAIGYTQSVLAYGQASEAPPKRRLVALSRVIDDVADVLALNGQTAIEWENRVKESVEVDADPDQLFRAIMNLVRNGVEALGRGDDPTLIRRLWVEAERQGGVVVLKICDTGPGVPNKARESLFEPFRGSARPGGTGLGLAIVSEIIRAHGGDIRLVDQAGAGAVFQVSLPDRPVELGERRRRKSG